MFILLILAALGACFGWTTGSVLAQTPAKQLRSFEFTQIQPIAYSGILAVSYTHLTLPTIVRV